MGWSGDVARERAALMRAQRRKIDLQSSVLRAEMVPRVQVSEVWARLVGNFKARSLAIPSKLAGRLIGLNDPAVVRQRIEREIHEALAELSSDGNLERIMAELEKLPTDPRGGAEDRDTPAAPDRKRVVRRKPPPKP